MTGGAQQHTVEKVTLQPKLESVPLDSPMFLYNSPMTRQQRVIKRTIDILGSLVLLIISAPIMVAIGLCIWLEDKGPIIFAQRRIGENGIEFVIFKFRSMVQAKNTGDAPAYLEVVNTGGVRLHKRPGDPRVTRVGKFIRRLSLDELPQLFNVLRGDMSLVGPRPELPQIVAKYSEWQYERLVVPPGLTGWWQVNGRSELPMHLNTQYDIFYVRNFSLWLDVRILFLTIPAVIKGRGAF